MEQMLKKSRREFKNSEKKDKYLEKLYRVYNSDESDKSYKGPFIKNIDKILKEISNGKITDEQKKDLISKIKEWNKKKVLNKSKTQHGGTIDNTIKQLFPDNSGSINTSNDNIKEQLRKIDKKYINPQEELQQIKQNIYDKEIVGTEDGYGFKVTPTNFGKKVKNFLKNAMKFRKSQIAILVLIFMTLFTGSLFYALGAGLIYTIAYNSGWQLFSFSVFAVMAIIILKTITGMLHIFSKKAECADVKIKNSSELIDYQSDIYMFSILGTTLLLISIRGLCNFIPWLSFDWFLWKLGLGIYILQQTITYHGREISSGINSAGNAFFVLCSFNALYQYISDSGESKIDDLSGLVNFGDILKSSYYLMDENNNSNISSSTILDASK
jgi:acid phosphatase family membrane protein YuiD